MSRYLVPSLFLLGTIVFGVLFLQEPPTDPLTQNGNGPKKGAVSFHKVEQYRKETAIKMGIDRQRAQIDKQIDQPLMDPNAREKNKFHKTEFGEKFDPRSEALADGSVYDALTLDQRMDQFLAKKQEYQMLEKVQKEAYVKQFIQEARKMGFHVIVNNKMEIEKVEKIKNQ